VSSNLSSLNGLRAVAKGGNITPHSLRCDPNGGRCRALRGRWEPRDRWGHCWPA
jgi:hypothetical protein